LSIEEKNLHSDTEFWRF